MKGLIIANILLGLVHLCLSLTIEENVDRQRNILYAFMSLLFFTAILNRTLMFAAM